MTYALAKETLFVRCDPPTRGHACLFAPKRDPHFGQNPSLYQPFSGSTKGVPLQRKLTPSTSVGVIRSSASAGSGGTESLVISPYLLDSAPKSGEYVAWAESNAVVFANTVLGARTAKHPDFLDLCIALTGRAPLAGVYLDEFRKPQLAIDVERPANADNSFWPLVGYLAGRASPDRIPILRGLAGTAPSRDDLKALCAAFGTTSAAAMLHIEGVTPRPAKRL